MGKPLGVRGGRFGVTLDGSLLRRRRRELGLTQEELAEVTRLTDRTVRAAERHQSLSISTARTLSASLGLPLLALIRWRPEEVQFRLAESGYAPVPPPTPWGGREVETRRVIEALTQAQHGAVCLLAGPTGIGKTALARFVVRSLHASFPDGIAWVHGARSNLERTLIWQLELAEALYFKDRLPQPEVVGRAAFDQAFRCGFWGRRRLLVLDDVAVASDVSRFVGPDDGGWVIVTTKSRAVAKELSAHLVEIGPLEEDAAVALLEAHLGVERVRAEVGVAKQLIRLLGGVPRSLQIAGHVLKHERYTRFADYLKRLSASPREPHDPWLDAPNPADASFTTAYTQLRERLSEASWKFFGAMSVFGARPFPADWAAAVGEVPLATANRCLAELANYYLLFEVDAPGRPSENRAVRFMLDAQSQRAARWTVGAAHAETELRLLEFASARAEALSAEATVDCLRGFEVELELWRHCLDLVTRALFPGPESVVARALDDIAPVDVERLPQGALLCRLLVALRKPLYLKHPAGTGEWLTAGLAVAKTLNDEAAFGSLCRVMARWAGVTQPDITLMRQWYDAAGQALLGSGQVDEAVDAMAYGAKAVFVTQALEPGLALLEAVLNTCRGRDVSNPTLASLLNSVAGCDLVVGHPGCLTRAEERLREALALDLSGTTGAVVQSIIRLNLATLRTLTRRQARRNEAGDHGPDSAEVAAVNAGLAELRKLMANDPLALFLLSAVARYNGIQSGDDLTIDDRLRRLVWLGVPPAMALRRVIRGIQFALELHQYFAPPAAGDEVSMPRRIREVGCTPLLIGHPIELDVPLPGLLYPIEPLLDLLAGNGLHYGLDFMIETVGPENPRLDLFRGLSRYVEGRGE